SWASSSRPASTPVRRSTPASPRSTDTSALSARSADGSPVDPDMRAVLRRLAPGTPLRDALDRIRRSGTGGLVVLGDDPAVRAICDGGVDFDVEFAPARLRELSK